jgi:hypothetical protein
MNEKIEIRSVEMVRRIRDEIAGTLKNKSHTDIIRFFKEAGKAACDKAKRHREVQPQ